MGKHLIFVVLLSVAAMASTGGDIVPGSVHQANATQTSFDVVWTTTTASTSQVLICNNSGGPYEVYEQFPATPDPSLVTNHRVTVTGREPYRTDGTGQYWIYVASVTAGGAMSTNPGPYDGLSTTTAPIYMATLATDTGGSPSYTFYTRGPHTAYTGNDMYFTIANVLIAGPVGHLYVQFAPGGEFNTGTDGVVDGPANSTRIEVHFICDAVVNSAGVDSADQTGPDPVNHLGYCYNGNNYYRDDVRIRVPNGTTPGDYGVTITLKTDGVTESVRYPFTVVTTPTSVVSNPHSPATIPGLAAWEYQMTNALGIAEKWCTYRDQQDALGIFEGFGPSNQSWFYDGFRIYMQIDDYTADVLGTPNHAHWQHCAQGVGYPYAYFYGAHPGSPGLYIFPAGLTMNYQRTNFDPPMKTAVHDFATQGVATHYQSSVAFVWPLYGNQRDLPYGVNSMLADIQLGNAASPFLQQAVDRVVGYMLIAAEGQQIAGSVDHVFMIGLQAETLMRWYRYTVGIGKPDYRIPVLLKATNDAVWANNWEPTNHMFNYNRLELPTRSGNADCSQVLNNMISQSYAWVWYMTGDTASLSEAQDIFSNQFAGSHGCYDFQGKGFAQSFEFSFDTVRLLNNNGLSYTDTASNVYTGAWTVTTPPVVYCYSAVPGYCNGTSSQTRWVSPDTTVTIIWQTWIPTDSQVFYGLTSAYGSQSALQDTGAGVTTHSVTLAGLTPGAVYHYKVVSNDFAASPNLGRSVDSTFTSGSGSPVGWFPFLGQ